jgi:hypothetical protein
LEKLLIIFLIFSRLRKFQNYIFKCLETFKK